MAGDIVAADSASIPGGILLVRMAPATAGLRDLTEGCLGRPLSPSLRLAEQDERADTKAGTDDHDERPEDHRRPPPELHRELIPWSYLPARTFCEPATHRIARAPGGRAESSAKSKVTARPWWLSGLDRASGWYRRQDGRMNLGLPRLWGALRLGQGSERGLILTGPPPKFHGTRDILGKAVFVKVVDCAVRRCCSSGGERPSPFACRSRWT